MQDNYDVVIIGGGPAGSTAGAFLKKYSPELSVAIFEREKFPRDHVGESQLPPLSYLLDEMGCWDKVEAANFPIKIGATYRWGKSKDLWDFEFIPPSMFTDELRPAKFAGQRRGLAFQVDRAVYDEILLDHAESLGCEVFQETKILGCCSHGGRVEKVRLESGEEISGRYFIDASGHSGFLRRSLGVKVDKSAALQNIAIWDYWTDAEWAVSIGIGGTRVQVLSIDFGWIWFIPLSPTRTSIGLIVPAAFYKECGLSPEELYETALRSDSLVLPLIKNAEPEGNLKTTKDWSFIAEKMVGENWFLAGESAGFADPILAAGLTISQAAAREAAYTIIALEEGKHDPAWLREEFEVRQSTQIKNHIRFANYWYSANAQFEDLKEYTRLIAQESGLELSPEKAWSWIAQGGFIGIDSQVGAGGFDLRGIKGMAKYMGATPAKSVLETHNIFRLNLAGATWRDGAAYRGGKVEQLPRYIRGEKVLPIRGAFQLLLNILQLEHRMPGIVARLNSIQKAKAGDDSFDTQVMANVAQSFEAMVEDGWVIPSYNPELPLSPLLAGFNQVKRNEDEIHWISSSSALEE
jgi:flavin-dependent dehydrogenase